MLAAFLAFFVHTLTKHPTPAQSRMEKWCSDRCEEVVCLKKGDVAYVNCWSCCYETCLCRGGRNERCGEAVAACDPQLTLRCRDIVKQAPKPPAGL